MLVIDASLAVEFALNTKRGVHATDMAFRSAAELHAPHLIDVEVAHALRRFVLLREVEASVAHQALHDFEELPLHRYPHAVFLHRIWELRNALSAYDAAYVALAEALHAPLYTCDARLSRSHGHRAEIRLIG
ncbi:MAG: type II toxin-antitoxin system VapC family toxin [Alphaproteobacteria bacterium]|nr:type II toxin-antitoxin system VapC family toxin [Alphaproteobacteria bacterium]